MYTSTTSLISQLDTELDGKSDPVHQNHQVVLAYSSEDPDSGDNGEFLYSSMMTKGLDSTSLACGNLSSEAPTKFTHSCRRVGSQHSKASQGCKCGSQLDANVWVSYKFCACQASSQLQISVTSI